jgi:hypothetical protein
VRNERNDPDATGDDRLPAAGGICGCAQRMAAQAAGDFVFLPHAGAWVFTDGDAPRRELTWRARYYLPNGAPDPTGEPVKYYVCWACGGDLPNVMLDVVREMDGLGDPEQ